MNSNWSYSPETPNLGQNRRFFKPCDLEIWRMTFKTIGHLFYASSSFVQHFVAMNSNWSYSPETHNLGLKSKTFWAVWPWNLKDDLQKQKGTSPKQHQAICIISSSYVNSNWSYSPETLNLGQIPRFLEPRDLEIWRMTLKNNRAPLLSNIKLYVSFNHHMWIQTGVTVRKQLSWVVTSVTLTFDLDLLHRPYPGPWW